MEGAAYTSFSTTVFKFRKICKKKNCSSPPPPLFHILTLREKLFFWVICRKVQIGEWSTNRLANLFQKKDAPKQYLGKYSKKHSNNNNNNKTQQQ